MRDLIVIGNEQRVNHLHLIRFSFPGRAWLRCQPIGLKSAGHTVLDLHAGFFFDFVVHFAVLTGNEWTWGSGGIGIMPLLLLVAAASICNAASNFQPVSDAHRSAALELFTPVDGSFGRSSFFSQKPSLN